jgi:hypothetical protein
MSWKLMDVEWLSTFLVRRLLEWKEEAQGGLLIFAEPDWAGHDGVHADTIERALEKYHRRPGGQYYLWPLHVLSTSELLRWLCIARSRGGFDPTDSKGYACWITYEEIKEVLATRPHIPNKAEGRRRRQERARRGKKPKNRRRPIHRKIREDVSLNTP